jgi:hypothetical protein
MAIGFAAAGVAGAAAGFAGAAGGVLCAQTGAAIARAAAMATPVKRCFMLVVLYGSSGFDSTATACSSCGEPSVETTQPLLRSAEHATIRVAYPIPPVTDIMTRNNQVSSTWGAADARN